MAIIKQYTIVGHIKAMNWLTIDILFSHGGGKRRHYYTRMIGTPYIVVAALASAMLTRLQLASHFMSVTIVDANLCQFVTNISTLANNCKHHELSRFFQRKNERSKVGQMSRQHAPKIKAVERLTFVCSQPAMAGPILKPMLHVTP